VVKRNKLNIVFGVRVIWLVPVTQMLLENVAYVHTQEKFIK
jgi:hypothetical protein